MGILNIKELKKYGEKLFKGKNMDNYKFINNMTKETPMEETKHLDGTTEHQWSSPTGRVYCIKCSNMGIKTYADELPNKEEENPVHKANRQQINQMIENMELSSKPIFSPSDKTLKETTGSILKSFNVWSQDLEIALLRYWTERYTQGLTSATIKARQEGYRDGYKQGRFDIEADKEFGIDIIKAKEEVLRDLLTMRDEMQEDIFDTQRFVDYTRFHGINLE